MDYKPRSRGVSRLYAHLILSTKYRYKVITPTMLERLKEIVADLCQKWQCELLECNGEPNHLHIVFRYFPQMQLSKFVNNLKSVSSRRIRQEFEAQVDAVYWKDVFWSESYSIDSCGNTPLEILRKYVQNQSGR
ncbi:IS200/IS605 family transposase [Phormidesmis priestleyi ULC007]|uniref:IS200/IS605 family transposase n=1 Tax=Phormidesmis priestleyi ULC007 TaxID=1920490 RepID=A0A2T1D3R3_9CYAN|nr:IS200/IS605 family transposase [Phormidesmis priestleyi]PSB15097.1 IS200/IS605 family transposase [Phormidesmis priestleyi ULC007]PZO45983.1 MAG: IS200/IS605 family transposase [Phormidesmis priestleyi]